MVRIGKSELELVQGDITEQDVEAIVNAANTSLQGGGGVDGAIHRAGGKAILEECIGVGPCQTGSAKITGAGELRAEWVIHAVGPVYRNGRSGEPEKLAGCYRRSMELAAEKGVASIAFPSISTGAYRYPVEDAAEIALRTVIAGLKEFSCIEIARFVLFDVGTYQAYDTILRKIKPK